MKALTLKETEAKVGIRKTAIYRLMAYDLFPKPIKIGRASRWIESELDEWLNSKVTDRVNLDIEIPEWIKGEQIRAETKEYILKVSKLTDEQRYKEAEITIAILDRIWGDKSLMKIRRARRNIARIDAKTNGSATKWLEETGAGNCPSLCVYIETIKTKEI